MNPSSNDLRVGDVQIDRDKHGKILSEWVIIEVFPHRSPSRVRRNSLAHHIHAEGTPILAESLQTPKAS